jgi:hypothetical protein
VNLLRSLVLLPVLLLSVAGCATRHQRYDWGSYDPSLYGYYKDPTKVAELSASLAAVIDEATANHAVVPPGIYAEYGYLQLQQGKTASAVELFKKEESRWPESKVFMDRMIKVASAPVAGTPTSGGAP